MHRDVREPRPDLSLQAWVVGVDNVGDLGWIYPDEAPHPAQPTALDDLPTPAPWDSKHMLWMVHADVHPETLAQVLERITPCSRVVLVDPRPAGMTALDGAARTRVARLVEGGRLHLVLGGSLGQRSEALVGLIDIDAVDGWKPILSRTLFEQEPQAVRDLLRRISADLNIRVMLKSTKIQGATRFLRNALLNAPWAQPPETLSPLAGTQTDRPALIVSAGPSLNKQLPTLARHQDLFTIIAVDTVWPILDAHGIVPDYLVALDPITPPSWPRDGLSPHTRFVGDVIAAPGMVWNQDRGHIMTSAHGQLTAILGSLGAQAGPLGIGGSVATQAFNLAVHLGANPIVLIGQDLALTGGRDHAQGYLHTYDEATLQERAEAGYDTEGYYGDTVRTERQLLVYKSWFEYRIQEMPERMVINATEGGARIAGSLQVPFAQVCEQIRATSLRKPVHPPAIPPAHDPAFMARLLAQLDRLRQSVREYQKLAARAESLTEGQGATATPKRLQQIDKLNRELKAFDPHAKLLVDSFGAGRMESIRYRTVKQDKESRTMDQALRRYQDVYRGIQEACEVSAELIERIGMLYEAVRERGRPDPDVLDAFLA